MEPRPDSRDFPSVMAELGMLASDSAEDLRRESSALQISPTRLALERGLLTADQAEIAEALLAPTDAIPGYELLSLVGQGGMGAVFRARQVSLNRIVALKTVLLNRIGGANSLARFEQEAVTLARLVHPHIVSAFDFGKKGAKIFLALEFVQGEDAEQFVRRRGSLEETFAWQLIRQTAAGLAHAAQLGIVHRDVKPANLLLVDPPAGFPLPKGVPLVKITDFGLALLGSDSAEATRLTSANTALGSPNYMAPEQVTGEAVDYRADIYALGATAYHFLAGEPPFKGMTLQAIVGQKLSTGPKPLESLRPELSPHSLALVQRMMALKPTDRPQSYDELFTALERWTGYAGGPGLQLGFEKQQRTANEQTQELPVAGALTDKTFITAADKVQLPSNATWQGNLLSRRSVIVTSALFMAALVGGAWLGRHSFSRPTLLNYESDRYVPEFPLFNGQSMRGFGELRGEWRPFTADEGARVLAGTNGSLVRFLPTEIFGTTAPTDWYYRITLIAYRNSSQSAFWDFGLNTKDPNSYHRLSVSEGKISIIPAKGSRFGQAKPLVLSAARDEVALQVVRHAHGWLVLINEQRACDLPAVPNEAPDRFRIGAEGGTAWFSDLTVGPWQGPSKPALSSLSAANPL